MGKVVGGFLVGLWLFPRTEQLLKNLKSCHGVLLTPVLDMYWGDYPHWCIPRKEETDNPSVVNSDLDSICFLCLSFDVWNVIYELSSHCFYGQK